MNTNIDRIKLLLESIFIQLDDIKASQQQQNIKLNNRLNDQKREVRALLLDSDMITLKKLQLIDSKIGEIQNATNKNSKPSENFLFNHFKLIIPWAISIGLLVTILINYSDFKQYQLGNYKYIYLHVSASEDASDWLDNFDREWGNDSIATARKKIINEHLE
jgi:hypothetical protein